MPAETVLVGQLAGSPETPEQRFGRAAALLGVAISRAKPIPESMVRVLWVVCTHRGAALVPAGTCPRTPMPETLDGGAGEVEAIERTLPREWTACGQFGALCEAIGAVINPLEPSQAGELWAVLQDELWRQLRASATPRVVGEA